MKIYIGSDHHGFAHKKLISNYLNDLGHEVVEQGDDTLNQSDDFPVYASNVAKSVLADNSPDSKGILLCGSGQGMVIAANRFKGIRASLCWDDYEAFAARNDDDSNILCLSADRQDFDKMLPIIDVWMKTPFNGAERFIRRVKELDKLG